jgi:hypothetical protein
VSLLELLILPYSTPIKVFGSSNVFEARVSQYVADLLLASSERLFLKAIESIVSSGTGLPCCAIDGKLSIRISRVNALVLPTLRWPENQK